MLLLYILYKLDSFQISAHHTTLDFCNALPSHSIPHSNAGTDDCCTEVTQKKNYVPPQKTIGRSTRFILEFEVFRAWISQRTMLVFRNVKEISQFLLAKKKQLYKSNRMHVPFSFSMVINPYKDMDGLLPDLFFGFVCFYSYAGRISTVLHGDLHRKALLFSV